MSRYLLKRLGMAVFTLYAVMTITFVMIQSIPGGPEDYIRAQLMQSRGDGTISMAQVSELAERSMNIDPTDPMHVQYVEYMSNMLQGDFGESLHFSAPVEEIIVQAMPWTLFLLSIATLLTFGIGIVLGAVMAYLEGSRFDVGSTVVSMFLNSIPYYIFALLAISLFAYDWGLFPASGHHPTGAESALSLSYAIDVVHHAALPILSLVITGLGGVALTMRGNAIQEIGEDYIRVANLRGVPSRRIATRYVGRNALLPMYTSLMISIGFMFGGAVVLEEIFAYEGIGWYLLQAVNARDYPLMMGSFLIITLAVVIFILIADLTYSNIDPRVEQEDSREAY